MEVAIAATQEEEGGPNKKTRVPRKKASAPLKAASQIREELNLELIHTALNQEQGVVNQILVAEEQLNVPLGESKEVESKDYVNDSDRQGPRRRETPMTKLKDDFREMRATVASLINQNQMMVEIIRSGSNMLSDATKPTYMKNITEPTT